jgi:hypothetical protein
MLHPENSLVHRRKRTLLVVAIPIAVDGEFLMHYTLGTLSVALLQVSFDRVKGGGISQ